MKHRIYRILLLITFINSSGFAQENHFWTAIKLTDIPGYESRYAMPEKFRTISVDMNRLRSMLLAAPLEFTHFSSALLLDLPMPDGSFSKFSIVESPMMEQGLAAQYPDFKTYGGQGIDNPYATVKISITRYGLHVMILSPEGTFFIDPFNLNNSNDYIIYNKKDLKARSFTCETADTFNPNESSVNNHSANKSHGTQLRSYRLAVAATGEYTAFHGGTVSSAMAAIVVSINRVNGVYENELATRLILVANNSSIVYTNSATDPYTNNNGTTMLTENTTNINSVIGTANYDIGHVFSTGGGGVATLNGPCGTNKARGVTGSSSPVGDAFDIDYVAHEMGHQFGASHTFNATTSNCGGGNRSASSAYEPGSGITIMAYAGICGAVNDLAPHSIAYFHTKSFDDITTFITTASTGGSCAVVTSTGNTPPVASQGSDYSIPVSTPFILTGSATDADNDPLVYSWEEYDLGNAGDWNAAQSAANDAPLFRPFEPVTIPSRTFPRLSDIINNTTTAGELLPSVARTLDFRLTVRDNRAGGGGVMHSDITKKITTVAAAGPFLVTAPNTAVSWGTSTSQTVTWAVASTDAAPVSCANVNILLSTDGGNTFPIVLASNTPNDGSEVITVPANVTTQARIKVEAAGNIFFDMSNADFSITAAAPVLTTIITTPPGASNYCAGTNLSVGFTCDGPANSGNVFTAQLSDDTGSFAVPANIGTLSGTNSGMISCTIPAGTAAGTKFRIRVISSNPAITGSDNGNNLSIYKSVNAAGAISGTAIVCQGQPPVAYAISSLTNATTYNWTLPSGATIATGAGTASITVNYGVSSLSGNITVAGSNAGCGNGISSSKSITVNALPAAAGSISGTSYPCAGSSGYIYSITAVAGATGYTWSLPSGASITSGSNTNSITVSFSAGAVSGNITVTPVNACGSGTVSPLFSIVIYQPPAPVTISAAGSTTTCSPGSVNLSFTTQPGFHYQWRKNGVNLSATDTLSSYQATQSGTYSVVNNAIAFGQQTFNSSGTITILDNSCSTPSSNIIVSGYSANVPSSLIYITMNISHSWVGDLVILLEAPNGQRLGLINRLNGGSNNGDNFINTVFSDAGIVMPQNTGAPYSATYKPLSAAFTVCTNITTNVFSFAGFGNGSINPNGQWRLRAFDQASVDDGTLNSWSITFPAFSPGCTAISNTIPVTILPTPVITDFTPSTIAAAGTVNIYGTGFSTATTVSFNGSTAAFTVSGDTLIQATVPAGATSGFISVTNSCGTANSPSAYTIVTSATLNLGVFIEGYYQTGGTMTNAIPGYADSITVNLIPASNLNVIAYSVSGLLSSTGLASILFPGAVIGNSYYIAIRQRNSLETWSKVPVVFTGTTSCNFRN
jgi:subtilisin-like proprotein convertase family protein